MVGIHLTIEHDFIEEPPSIKLSPKEESDNSMKIEDVGMFEH
jgi:hypothetical protein